MAQPCPTLLEPSSVARSNMKHSAGFSLLEVLIAATIGSVALLGFSEVFQRYQLTQKKVAAVLLATGAEVDLVLQLENPLSPSYTPAIKSIIEAGKGGDISSITFPLHFSDPTSPTPFTVPISANGTKVFIKKDGSVCTAGSFSDPDCSFSAQLMTQFSNGRHSFSYEIQVNPSIAVIAPLGDHTIFSTYAPAELYQPVALQQCDTGVPSIKPVGDIAVRGINRSTGQVYCISKPTSPCPSGTFPTGTQFVDDFSLGGTSGGHLEMKCASPPKPSVSCNSPEYVLQSYSATASGSSGSCVYRLMSPQAWPKTYKDSKSVTIARACPINYVASPSCVLTKMPPAPSPAICGPFTTGWSTSCDKDTICDTYSTCAPEDTTCTPTCTSSHIKYTKVWSASNGSGKISFPSPAAPNVKVTLLNGDQGFKCEVIYPDLPWFYSSYSGTYYGSTYTKNFGCDKPVPQWEAAEMTVNFECRLKAPYDSTMSAN